MKLQSNVLKYKNSRAKLKLLTVDLRPYIPECIRYNLWFIDWKIALPCLSILSRILRGSPRNDEVRCADVTIVIVAGEETDFTKGTSRSGCYTLLWIIFEILLKF